MADEAPDMAALREAGVSLEDAIRQCEVWRAANPEPGPIIKAHVAEPEPAPKRELNLAMYRPPVVKPKPMAGIHNIDKPALGRPYASPPVVNEPAKPPESIGRMNALSLLHTLVVQIETERGDINVLLDAGFSLSTARELTTLIQESRSFHP